MELTQVPNNDSDLRRTILSSGQQNKQIFVKNRFQISTKSTIY